MTEQNNTPYLKCPHCACIFFTRPDLEKHITIFGKNKEQHDMLYKNTHGILERGFSDE